MSGSEGLPVLGLTMGGSATLLRPVAFQATEAISRPFKVTVEMVSDQSSIDQDSVLYKPACLSVVRQNNGTRYFNGVVSSFSGKGTPVRSKWRYTATIAPRLWFMEQTTDCRIFQGCERGRVRDDQRPAQQPNRADAGGAAVPGQRPQRVDERRHHPEHQAEAAGLSGLGAMLQRAGPVHGRGVGCQEAGEADQASQGRAVGQDEEEGAAQRKRAQLRLPRSQDGKRRSDARRQGLSLGDLLDVPMLRHRLWPTPIAPANLQ